MYGKSCERAIYACWSAYARRPARQLSTIMYSAIQYRHMRGVAPRHRRESAVRMGDAMSFGDVLWVLAVFAFWGLVFCLMFLFVSLISRGRDNEETACELPSPTVSQTDIATHAPA